MKNFEFKSQICTTREQSERLLKLGLKKETADMHITNMSTKGLNYTDDWQIGSISYCDAISFWDSKGLQLEKTAWSIIPAWSLHRLMLLYDKTIEFEDWNLNEAYEHIMILIEDAIRGGFFNTQFLEDKQ